MSGTRAQHPRRDAAAMKAPPTATTLPPGLVAAYRETDYHVFGEPPFVLRIGEPSVALRALHASLRVRTSAFITACNPFSEPLGDAENATRQAALARELASRGLSSLAGEGRHPANGWPGEASLLVPGIAAPVARELGETFGQNAIVFCGEDAMPTLIVLR